ncbi:SEC7-like guanine nucleotide exchange family protein [Rhynchospora pubera]|uniref:SEC7-like guanine nucleotide exchange family protein n=1 Tax=Rhynchospora pubera TaxID=906938 RepID=A0AAV8FGU9_9POAL|nr:SEC7-like guanine nucleotide exchange family protein [Rhynchospora pubera]
MGLPPRPIPIPTATPIAIAMPSSISIEEKEEEKEEEREKDKEREREKDKEKDKEHSLSCAILSEISSVLASLRRHTRHSSDDFDPLHSSTSSNPLLLSFASLRRALFAPSFSFSALLLLRPFLDTIRSDLTPAPVTAAALSSLLALLTLPAPLDLRPALPQVVDAVAACRFDAADHHAEPVLLDILHVLLECVKPATDGSVALDDHHVCTAVNTCFRIVHQAAGKTHLLQTSARDAMLQLVRRIFARLPLLPSHPDQQVAAPLDKDPPFAPKQMENGTAIATPAPLPEQTPPTTDDSNGPLPTPTIQPYGVPCMVEIFHFLCSLLNMVEQVGVNPGTNTVAFDEDVPLFALRLINTAIQLGGPSIRDHPKLLSLVQDELFRNLMQFGLSTSPLILSTVCSIVLNLYQNLRTELKMQLEAFFSCIILRLAQSKFGATYQQQEVAMEALVDFCRQRTFMVELFANFDCDITCRNVFEELSNLLSRSAFPLNSPLSSMHVLALEGLIAVVQGMADRLGTGPLPEQAPVELTEYAPFWTVKCASYTDPEHWVKFVRQRKYIKRRLMIGADHFNRDPKKGLEFLQGTHLLPEKLDPQSVACFFRYTAGLDKNLVGDFLGNHDEFCVQVLREFAWTFDFEGMNLDTALRLFLETFRLPGESQKIQRVLEAFSERYFEQSPHILANKDAALLLSYSLIMLNTDQHNVQVKKKMTEEDFIRNNRHINGGNDLPREYLIELYHSICRNEIRTIPEQGFGFFEMSPSRWVDLMRRSKTTPPYIVCGSWPHLDRDMFAVMSGPAIAAVAVVFDHAENAEVLSTCADGFLAIAKISAFHHLEDVLDDLVVSLCKFTTLLSVSAMADEPVTAFGDDLKARLATEALFLIATRYGDFVRTGWRNILDCILRLHKLGLLPARVASDAAEDADLVPEVVQGKPLPSSLSSSNMQVMGTPRRSSGLMGRFSQLLSLDTEEPRSQPTEQQLVAHQRTLQTIQKCRIESIFTESKFLNADSLLQLARALIWAAGRPQKMVNSSDDEDTAVFCLELLIAITLNNRDRIVLLWQGVYEHISNIVQSTVMPCALVEKAVLGLLRICQRLLPYKENLADELLRSLQLVAKLDARVADAYCERIALEVSRLVHANASHIRSQAGWRAVMVLLSITARHQEASEHGFDGLKFIMMDGEHITPANYALCVEASRLFAESRVEVDRSVRALDLLAGSVSCLAKWSKEAKEAVGEEGEKMAEAVREMWLRLAQALRKTCLDPRDEVRNHALSCLQKILIGSDGVCLLSASWLQAFDLVVFATLDDLLENASQKDYRNMETSLVIAVKLLSKVYLHLLPDLFGLSSFCKLWLGVLSRMEKFIKAKIRGKRSEKLQEVIPDLLRNILMVMKDKGILAKRSTIGGDSLWDLTWLHVNNISSSLQAEVFPGQDFEPDPRRRDLGGSENQD